MKFHELVAKHHRMDFYIRFEGATSEVRRKLENFYSVFQEHYTQIEVGNREFDRREVPRAVVDSFNPIFEEFRRTYRAIMRRG